MCRRDRYFKIRFLYEYSEKYGYGFFLSECRKATFLWKRKFLSKYTNANIVFCVVVQAAPSLYKPGDNPSAAIIVLHGLDQKHKKDFDFLRNVVDCLVAMRDGEKETPSNLKKLVNDLNNPKSHIHTKISGEEIDPQKFVGAELLLDTVYTSQSRLPGTRIPNDRVLAMLEISPSQDHTYYQLIQGEFYEKD